jgi:eukaryotic-like serine/threonine-protein kinase
MSSILEQVGRVIGGRYRLLAVVGAGASAQVYAADDTRLGRRVAVKLLHPALAGDVTFLRKFQAEARLAASLNHRNVLHVYDWGDDDGMPYLVLEYLGGGSLRSLLDTGALLSPQQAAALGIEAANGLAYAHRRGLVHRDIKPANLLFDDDGRLLVADFGLARALAEAALTEPLGTVMGTARYASPEQVEGRPVDDRTDVYSLALSLYESVTGRVPFVGDTTVATLMARVGAVLPPARELGPLAPVLAQAAISEPLARLDAAALASELEMLLLELDPPEPLPLNPPDLALPRLQRGLDPDPTERIGIAVVPTTVPDSPSVLTASPGQAAPPAPQAPRIPGEPTPARQGAAPVTRPSPPGVRRIIPPPRLETVLAEPPRRTGRKHRWLPWLLVVVLLEALAGAGVLATSRGPTAVVVKHVKVPQVVRLQKQAAIELLLRAGLMPVVAGFEYDARAAAGTIIIQRPRHGLREKADSVVRFAISRGPHPTTLPDLKGLTEAKAAAALRRARLFSRFSQVYSETVPSGNVVSWTSLAGTRVVYGDKVDVVVSKGYAPQTIPSDLKGGIVTWAQASAALADLHLKAMEEPEYSTTISPGFIVTTRPSPGQTVPGHSTVVVYASIGKPFVNVPGLITDSVSVAEQKLRSLGLTWRLYGPPGANFVLAADPGFGRSVRMGSTILLYLY